MPRKLNRVTDITLPVALVCLCLTAMVAAGGDAALEADGAAVLDRVVVYAGRVVQLQEESAAPISVVDRDEIDLRQARGLDDLLRDMPGVTIAQGPRRDGLMPVIRGLGDGRVVVRIDGARQNFQRSHRARTFIEPNLLQRVEVLRGPASTLYGSGAIGGVVDLRTVSADDLLVPGQSFGGQFRAGLQSNADEKVGALTLAGQGEGFGLLGSVSRSQAGDYRDGDGDREPFSGSDVWSGLVKAHWDVGPASRVTATHIDFEDSSTSHSTADRPFDPARLPQRSVDRRSRQQTSTVQFLHQPGLDDLWELEATLYRNDFDQDDRPLDINANRTQSALTTWGVDVFNTSHLQLAGMDHVLTYGVEYFEDDQQGFSAGRPDRGFSDSEQDTFGLFMQDRLRFSRADLILGVRYDRIRQTEESGDGRQQSTFNEISPQATLSYRMTETVAAYASYAEAFRVPNLRERFIGGIHFGTNQFLPNPDLEPEKARNTEVGMTFIHRNGFSDGDRLRGQISVYENNVDNFIEQIVRQADSPGDPALANTTRFENVGKARLRGMEIDLSYDHPGFLVTLVGSRIRGDDRRGNRPLEGIPADSLALNAAVKLSYREMLLGARVVATARQDRLPPTTNPDAAGPTAGYTLLDLYTTFRPLASTRVDLRIDNVFDRHYRQAPNLVPGLGRNIRVQFGYEF